MTRRSSSRRTGIASWTLIAALFAGAVLIEKATALAPPDFSGLGPRPVGAQSAPQSTRAQAGMRDVPAGRYPLGRNVWARDQRPAHHVDLAAFRIDRTEVTNAAFAEFLDALGLEMSGAFGIGAIDRRHVARRGWLLLTEGPEGGGRYPIIALDDDQSRIVFAEGRFRAAPGYENHPVAETTWAGARAYCLWRGGDLPSEAQWEAAARGQGDRLYPWGDAPPDLARAFVSGRSGVTAAVGSAPAGASPFGVLDMAGSLAEWTRSLKRPYPYDPHDGREHPDLAGERVTRGGDYVYDRAADRLGVSHRDGFSNAPGRGHRHIGFRCASR